MNDNTTEMELSISATKIMPNLCHDSSMGSYRKNKIVMCYNADIFTVVD